MSLPVAVPGITVLETLAYGGFAVVYRARQESVGREVALKVDNRLARDERDRRRFLREARAAGQLSDHPSVISVYDAGITPDERPYLVMELCPGGSLAERLRRDGPMPPTEVRDIGVTIAGALQYAHDAGVLHRDVKPANVLINRFGSPGLADFGMAASFTGLQQVSATLEALTPAFAPPEVFRHEVPTTAVDVYGLAATLYCLLSGRPPRWPAEGHPSIATIIGFQNDPIPDIPGAPGALTAVLRKSLAPDAADRHPTAAALRDALRAVTLDVPSTRGVESADVAPSSGRAARRGRRHLTAVSAAGHTSAGGARSVEPVALRTGSADRPPRQASAARPSALEQAPPRESTVEQAPPHRSAVEQEPPRRSEFSRESRPEAARTIARQAPFRSDRPAWRRSRLAVVAAAVAAVLGVGAAVAVNTRSRGHDRVPSADSAAVGIGVATRPVVAGGSTPPPTGAAASPSVRPSSPVSAPPKRQPRLRTADANVISGLGLGPFRVGEPAQPLLTAGLARRPDSDDPCPAAAQLLSTDPRYREQFQTLSAHTASGTIAHVTIFTEAHATRQGLRVGSTVLAVTAAFPQAQRFGSLAPSFLVRDGQNALLFVVRNAVTMAIVAGPVPELTRIGEQLGRRPDDLAPLC